MKLPELDSNSLTKLTPGAQILRPFELAQLHCLRSIATSLECLVAMRVQEVKGMTRATKTDILSRLDAHSVMKGGGHARAPQADNGP